MAKEEITVEIKKSMEDKKLVLGTKRVIKELRLGKFKKVYVSSNCPKDVVADINKYGEGTGTEVVLLDFPSPELGVLCKKQFFISVAGLIK